MAVSARTVNTSELANWIPVVWSKLILADVENSLVTAALCDRSYEQFATAGGDTIVVPHLAEISANVVNTELDMTLYSAGQDTTNIAIDKKYDLGVAVSDLDQIQTNPKYFDKVRSKLAFGLAKQLDINCNVEFLASFSNTVGTTGAALTEDDLIKAYEHLNASNAPHQDRAWVFDPASITDLLKLDYFIRMDYVPGSVVSQGFQGRQIFGSPVYISTNLDKYNSTNEHQSGYFQREAIALVLQMPPRFETGRLILQHVDAIVGVAMWGVKTMRGSFGVLINCRA